MRAALVLATVLALSPLAASADAPQVKTVDGNVVVETAGKARTLTTSGRDTDPVVTPDGKSVIFTRLAVATDGAEDGCRTEPPFDQLVRVTLDGGGETVLLEGRSGTTPQESVCEFFSKQFSSDGKTLYFLTPAWATSAALYTLDLATGTTRFIKDASGLIVLNDCESEDHRDRLVIMLHRYFVFGGSYDWYWLYDPSGREIGPVGEFDSEDGVREAIRDSGLCGP